MWRESECNSPPLLGHVANLIPLVSARLGLTRGKDASLLCALEKSNPHSISSKITMPFFNIGSTAAASSSSTAVLPPDHPPVPAGTDACPVDHSVRSKWLEAAPSTSNPLHHPPSFSSGPQKPGKLSDEREISSIPRGKASSSDHIGSSEGRGVEHEKWVYPSERQFYNAMQRKNHNPKAKDMKSVVPIHNAVNEKAWEEILMWEAGMGGEKCGGCRLLSFSGRPKDRTPKAWINVALG